MSTAPLIGVICGAQAEAAALGALWRDTRLMVVFSGARPGRAEAQARACLAAGCRALLSFGTAGGLAPGLAPGALLAPAAVLAGDGTRWEPAPWLVPQGTAGDLLGADRLVADPAAKAALHAGTGAVAVDMESHRVARVAAEAGLPFGLLRAVLDPVERALPPAAAAALGPEGQTRPGALALALMRGPRQIGALLALGRDFRAARAALARAVTEVLPQALERLAATEVRLGSLKPR